MLHLKRKNTVPAIIAIVIMSLCSCSSNDDEDTSDEIPNNRLLRANLSVTPGTIMEGESATITLMLDETNTTGSNLVFDFNFAGTIDPQSDVLSLASTTLVIPDGSTETSLEITSVDDDEMEDTETFTLDITGFPDAAVAGTSTNIVLSITDND